MKRASYREAIEWVARYDEAGDERALDPEFAGSVVSAILVANIFDVSSDKVGADIVRRRKQIELEGSQS